MAGSLQTYAPWPVWRDSTTAEVRFTPLAKKKAVQLWHKAREFERRTRRPGRQDGALGRNGLAVLQTLLFDFLNYASGRLDPSQSAIARKACISERSVTRGLANLKLAGVLFWLRRAVETRDEHGRFCLDQDTNAYGVLPPGPSRDWGCDGGRVFLRSFSDRGWIRGLGFEAGGNRGGRRGVVRGRRGD